jgi:hypothetical protein
MLYQYFTDILPTQHTVTFTTKGPWWVICSLEVDLSLGEAFEAYDRQEIDSKQGITFTKPNIIPELFIHLPSTPPPLDPTSRGRQSAAQSIDTLHIIEKYISKQAPKEVISCSLLLYSFVLLYNNTQLHILFIPHSSFTSAAFRALAPRSLAAGVSFLGR